MNLGLFMIFESVCISPDHRANRCQTYLEQSSASGMKNAAVQLEQAPGSSRFANVTSGSVRRQLSITEDTEAGEWRSKEHSRDNSALNSVQCDLSIASERPAIIPIYR